MTDAAASAQTSHEVSPAKMRQVVAASAAGTVFEWYDFFVYGALASVISPIFFAGLPDAQAFVFTLLTFARRLHRRARSARWCSARSATRPAARAPSSSPSRIMGLATFAIGLLADGMRRSASGRRSCLVTCRVLQGFALGGEYGGAAIYVAEHAHPKKRGAATGWIQTSAAIGLVGALHRRAGHALHARRRRVARLGLAHSVPALGRRCSAISVWIRLQLEESPAFKKLQAEGKVSKQAYAESFFEWRNLQDRAARAVRRDDGAGRRLVHGASSTRNSISSAFSRSTPRP